MFSDNGGNDDALVVDVRNHSAYVQHYTHAQPLWRMFGIASTLLLSTTTARAPSLPPTHRHYPYNPFTGKLKVASGMGWVSTCLPSIH